MFVGEFTSYSWSGWLAKPVAKADKIMESFRHLRQPLLRAAYAVLFMR